MKIIYSFAAVIMFSALATPMEARSMENLSDPSEGVRKVTESSDQIRNLLPSRGTGRMTGTALQTQRKTPQIKRMRNNVSEEGDLPTIRGHVYYSENKSEHPQGDVHFHP